MPMIPRTRRRLAFGLSLIVTVASLLACHRKSADPLPAAADPAEAGLAAADATSLDASGAATATPQARPVWTSKLASEEDFLHYSKVVGAERFTKFVVDLASSAIYYVDADLYPMHKDFIFAELLKVPRTKEAEQLFDRNYGKDKPNFLMCYLVHHLEPDVWTLAFWDGDKATAAHVRLAFKRMRETFYLASKVKFRPNSNDQEAVAAEVTEIPTITNDALYKAVGYQPFHKGTAVGKLHIVRATAGAGDAGAAVFAPDEIVILPEPLTDITPVAGIISQSFSTPLSHVNIRAAAWDIPNVGLRNAAKTYAALDGKMVRFEAGATSATLQAATPQEIEASKKAHQQRTTVLVPKANLAATALATLDTLHAADASAYGSKTSNLGEIVTAKLAGVAVPAGFGIPISFYAKHLEAAGIDAHVATMLADPKFRASMAERKTALEKLRQEIQDAPLAPAFVASLGESLQKLTAEADAGAEVGVFVRSSTNAEDLPGFSGAGLYDTVPNVRGAAAVALAVKKVWASVWNLAAYEERELYRIDHRQVYCAVLVQIGISATAAGVLVTAHPTDPTDRNTFTINAKSGLGMRVVDGKKLPEILLYNVFNKGLRIVSRSDEDTMLVFQPDGGVHEISNPKKGDPILTNARVAKLADAAQKLRGIFPKDRPLDIEWVLRGEEVFIVQSRPYMGGPAALGSSPRPAP
ncbi:MAG: Pyruvate phosphate dikinase [Myxococcaceae bacterium]|nr:Pyruvate phosphate dikinase [Myxococcaceae bacterium]